MSSKPLTRRKTLKLNPAVDVILTGEATEISQEPIFVHSGFRTSSTWLWLKLRQSQAICAYYEPYNEILTNMPPSMAKLYGSTSWNSNHPHLESYFEEYIPLLRPTGGMPLLHEILEEERFIPSTGVDGTLPADEIEYLSFLIDAARAEGRRPALCDTRTLGRARAIRTALGGVHILLHRNLYQQWCSFAEQSASGNAYFLENVTRCIRYASFDPFLASLRDLLPEDVSNPDTPGLFAAVTLFQLYSNGVAFDACDNNIGITAICSDPIERRAAELLLSDLSGMSIQLDDAEEQVGYGVIGTSFRKEAEQLVRTRFAEMHVPGVSEDCIHFLEKSVTSMFREWDRAIHYAGRTQTFLGNQNKSLNQALERSNFETASLTSDLDKAESKIAKLLEVLVQTEDQLVKTESQLVKTEGQLVKTEGQLVKTEGHRSYLLKRSIWERLLFRPSGRPVRIVRRILFHKSGKPRDIFKSIVLRSDGQPQKPFKIWMGDPSYVELTGAVKPIQESNQGQAH